MPVFIAIFFVFPSPVSFQLLVSLSLLWLVFHSSHDHQKHQTIFSDYGNQNFSAENQFGTGSLAWQPHPVCDYNFGVFGGDASLQVSEWGEDYHWFYPLALYCFENGLLHLQPRLTKFEVQRQAFCVLVMVFILRKLFSFLFKGEFAQGPSLRQCETCYNLQKLTKCLKQKWLPPSTESQYLGLLMANEGYYQNSSCHKFYLN